MNIKQNKHISKIKMTKNDEYYTPIEIWNKINHIFKQFENKIIYEPFFGKGHSFNIFKEKGFEVLGDKDIDFFSNQSLSLIKKSDIIITNPPFSLKYKIMDLLVKEDKPFCLILPLSCINTHSFRRCFNNNFENMTVLIPKGRLVFIKNNYEKSSPSFECCFITYKISKDKIVFLEQDLNENKK